MSCELAEAEAAAPGPPATTTTHHGSRNKDAWLCLARGGRAAVAGARARRARLLLRQAGHPGHKAHWLAPALAWPFLAAKSGLPPASPAQELGSAGGTTSSWSTTITALALARAGRARTAHWLRGRRAKREGDGAREAAVAHSA